MPKIVILGSTRFHPYEVLAKPNPINPAYTIETHDQFQSEDEYQKATEVFYPAIEAADLVIVYAPDGVGDHTKRDILHAVKHGKRVVVVQAKRVFDFMPPWEG